MIGGVAATMFLFTACKKDRGKEVAQENYTFNNKASFQMFNAVLGSSRSFLYVDAQPVNGATIATGSAFPNAVAPSSFSVLSGFRAFMVRDTLTTSAQPVMTFGEDVQAGRNYTLFTYDTFTSPRNKLVTNNIVIPTDTTARLRFANLLYAPSLVPNIDVFSKKRNAVIFSNVAPGDVTDFIPYASALNDSFYVRVNGTSTNLQNLVSGNPVDILVTLNPTIKRSYTLVFRGGYRTNVSTAGTVRTLTTFANY